MEKGEFDTLISSAMVVVREKMDQMHQGADDAHCGKLITRLLFKGKLQSMTRYATKREGEGVS